MMPQDGLTSTAATSGSNGADMAAVDCVFCGIVAGTEPASFVFQDDVVVAFLVLHPITPGHLIIIPHRHAVGLTDLDEPTGRHMFTVAQRLAAALRRSGLRCEGVNMFLADGAAAFQDVFHVHLHVIPRFAGDPFKIDADWSTLPTREDLDAIAAQIRRGG